MERFIKFKEDVSLKLLSEALSDTRIIILRESKTTGTIQVKLLEKMTSKEIKTAFKPYAISKIFHEFPYPIGSNNLLEWPLVKLKRLVTS